MKKKPSPSQDPASFELYGIIGLDVTLEDFSSFIFDNLDNEINILMHSPGGLLFDAIGIHNLIKNHPYKVSIDVISLAASAASYICTAADEVIVSQNSVYMIHNVHSFAYGDHNKLRDSASFIERLSNMLITSYCQKSGLDSEIIKKFMDEVTFFLGQEIIDNNFADTFEPSAVSLRKEENLQNVDKILSDCKTKLEEKFDPLDQLSKAAALLDSLPITLDKDDSKGSVEDENNNSDESNDSDEDENKSEYELLEKRIISELNDFSSAINDLTHLINSLKENRGENSANDSDDENNSDEENPLLFVVDNFTRFVDTFKEYLNSKIDDKSILPSQAKVLNDFFSSLKELFFSEINDEDKLKLLIDNVINQFDSFIAQFEIPNLLDDIAIPADNIFSNDSVHEDVNIKNSVIDPESRLRHNKILELMRTHNLTYLSAAQEFLKLSKEYN